MRITTLAITAVALAGAFGIAYAEQGQQGTVSTVQDDSAAASAADDQAATSDESAATAPKHKVLTMGDFGEHEGSESGIESEGSESGNDSDD